MLSLCARWRCTCGRQWSNMWTCSSISLIRMTCAKVIIRLLLLKAFCLNSKSRRSLCSRIFRLTKRLRSIHGQSVTIVSLEWNWWAKWTTIRSWDDNTRIGSTRVRSRLMTSLKFSQRKWRKRFTLILSVTCSIEWCKPVAWWSLHDCARTKTQQWKRLCLD